MVFMRFSYENHFFSLYVILGAIMRLHLLALGVVSFSACRDKETIEDNTAPSIPEISLTPNDATTLDDLQVNILTDSTDPQGDSITYSYQWIQDDVPVDNEAETLSSELTAKGEVWKVRVRASDGLLESDYVEASLVIGNAPPVVTVSIAPEIATTEDELTLVIEASDPDDDELSFTYSWMQDGSDTGFSDASVAASATTRDEEWSVTVVANDGELDSESAQASITIQNALPVVSELTLSPEEVYEGDVITATLTSTDADGDPITLTYAWSVDGSLVQTSESSILTSDLFAKGNQVSVAVTPNDGTEDGETLESDVLTILNTAPVFTSVSLEPTEIYTDTNVTCIPTGWYDADEDAEDYTYEWTVDGAVVGNTQSLDSSLYQKGHVVECTATAFDGEESGMSSSASLTVQNTAPSTTAPSLSPTTAYSTTDLTCSVGTSSDIDGDTVTDNFAWTVNGSVVPNATGQLLPSSFFVGGDEVVCTVTPYDGTESGDAVESTSVVITNSAPEVTQVSIINQDGSQNIYTNYVLSVDLSLIHI